MSDFDFTMTIEGDVLDGVITTSQDDEGSNCYTIALQTQPNFVNEDGEEIENPYDGFSAVKKYRLNLPSFNPSNQKVFASNDEVMGYVLSLPDNCFSPWFDDPVEESE